MVRFGALDTLGDDFAPPLSVAETLTSVALCYRFPFLGDSTRISKWQHDSLVDPDLVLKHSGGSCG